MDAALQAFVRKRAGHRCEYCRLHEDDADFLAFHIEHFIAKQHGGTDDRELLCYACSECNWAKGPNLSGILRGKIYPLFNPRKQNWTRHSYWDHTTLVGKTKTGMVTVQVLNINKALRVMLRENLLFEGRFPPVDQRQETNSQTIILGIGSCSRRTRICDVLIHCYGALDGPAGPVFGLLLRYAVSEDGALHAEKFYRTVAEVFAATRKPFRWRQLVALARVTASEFGQPAPGYAESRKLLKV